MEEQFLRNYARVILTVGVNLQDGQKLLISSEPVHWEFVTILAEEAYKMGAQFVRVEAQHPTLLKARVAHAKESTLDYIPTNLTVDQQTMIDERWALVHLDGMEDPNTFDALDQDRNVVIQKAGRMARRPLSAAMTAGVCSWVNVSVPTEKWAAQILGTNPSPEAVEELWKVFIPILHLDTADPVQSWQDHSDTLKKRGKILSDSRYDYIRFVGPDTDLKIGLTPKSVWAGGVFKSKEGHEFLPNLPTYEVFTTPNYKLAEGRVKVMRPVKVLGSTVENAWFEFKDGGVVDFGASKGRELLEKYFSIDEQSSYLGEVALVDIQSPIFQSGKVFNSILYDENAACHIALGRGLTTGLENGADMSEDELKALGCNMSLQHTDFMVGSPEVSVFGIKEGQPDVTIIKNGEFVI